MSPCARDESACVTESETARVYGGAEGEGQAATQWCVLLLSRLLICSVFYKMQPKFYFD